MSYEGVEDHPSMLHAVHEARVALCHALLPHAQWVWQQSRRDTCEESLTPRLPETMRWGWDLFASWAPLVVLRHYFTFSGSGEYQLYADGELVGSYLNRAAAVVYGDNLISTWRLKELGK